MDETHSKSITLGYKQEKVRLVMELRDSSNRTVTEANAREKESEGR